MHRQFLVCAWGLIVVAGLLGVWSKRLAARSAVAAAEKTQERAVAPKIIAEQSEGTVGRLADYLSVASLALALTALASLAAAHWLRGDACVSLTDRVLWSLAASGAVGEVLLALMAM